MTPERAQEIIRAQRQWPYWGNYSRFMTAAELHSIRFEWLENGGPNSSLASTVHKIARGEITLGESREKES
jgi:hypothetical protein